MARRTMARRDNLNEIFAGFEPGIQALVVCEAERVHQIIEKLKPLLREGSWEDILGTLKTEVSDEGYSDTTLGIYAAAIGTLSVARASELFMQADALYNSMRKPSQVSTREYASHIIAWHAAKCTRVLFYYALQNHPTLQAFVNSAEGKPYARLMADSAHIVAQRYLGGIEQRMPHPEPDTGNHHTCG